MCDCFVVSKKDVSQKAHGWLDIRLQEILAMWFFEQSRKIGDWNVLQMKTVKVNNIIKCFNMLCNFSLIPIISSRNRFVALHTEIFNVPQWYLIIAINSLTSSNSSSMSMFFFFATCINEWLNSQHIIVTQTKFHSSPLMFSIRYPFWFSLICLFDMCRPKSSHAYTALFLRKNIFKNSWIFLHFSNWIPCLPHCFGWTFFRDCLRTQIWLWVREYGKEDEKQKSLRKKKYFIGDDCLILLGYI